MKNKIAKIMIASIVSVSMLGNFAFAEAKYSNELISSVKSTLEKDNDYFRNKVKMFKDMGKHWADIYAGKLVEFGAIKGYEDGTFRPNGTITRAEFSTMIANMFKIKGTSDKSDFTDVSNHWANKSISNLVENGVIVSSEYGDKYEPNKQITRVEMAKMLVRVMDLDVKSKEGVKTKFSDDTDIKDADKAYVILATENKIIAGYEDNTFKPNKTATRAEASTMIVSMLHKITSVEVKPYNPNAVSVTKSEYLPKISLQEAGIDMAKANEMNKFNERPIESIIKGDVNQFPVELGTVVITGIEYVEGKKVDSENNFIVIHAYGIKDADKNGIIKGADPSIFTLNIQNKNGKSQVVRPRMLENPYANGFIKEFPDAGIGTVLPLNQNFSTFIDTDYNLREIEKIQIMDSCRTDKNSALEINGAQIKKH